MNKKKGKAPATGGIVYSTDPDWTPQAEGLEVDTLPATQQRLRVEYSRAGRAGEEAFTIRGFVDSDSDLADLARQLKQSLGCGGSTRDGEILIQQNNKERLIKLPQSKGYKDVKQKSPHPAMPIEKTSILEMQRLTTEEYHTASKIPLTILLDNVRSMYNIGSIFRTADAFRIEEPPLVGITGCLPHPLLHKTAIEAEGTVPWRHLDSAIEALEQCRQERRIILTLEQTHQSIILGSQPALDNRGTVLTAGNEVHGVSDEVIQYADYHFETPQYGIKHSLSVSIATGITIYDLCTPYLERHHRLIQGQGTLVDDFTDGTIKEIERFLGRAF